MSQISTTQAIELFHLLFLAHLEKSVDRSLYVLKGGCNLRFFLRSIRYSEDIDLDVHTTSKETLQKNVDKVVASRAFADALNGHGLRIERVTAPKQTETTQRWRIALLQRNSALSLRTKIEFSRRATDFQQKFEQVDPLVIREHGIYPISLNHYAAESAYSQKIVALANRREIQARDVFDLYFLEQYGYRPPTVSRDNLSTARENCSILTYDDYVGQVVAFLKPEYMAEYRSVERWDEIQLAVHDTLESIENGG